MKMSDTAVEEANHSEEEPEIVTDEDENRKKQKTATEALKKLDKGKHFIEVKGRDHLNMIFNELIENVEQIKLKNKKQSYIRSFFASKIYLFILFIVLYEKNLPS